MAIPPPRVDLSTIPPPAPSEFEAAERFRYDVTIADPSKRWQREDTKVKWTTTPVGKGGMRDCCLVWEADADGSDPHQMIGKVFQKDVQNASIEDYMDEAITQTVADTYAQKFNKMGIKMEGSKISFLSCFVVKLKRRGANGAAVVFTMEPMLRGAYEKHNNNYGEVYTDNPIAETFSHFTFEASNRKLLICDIQGVGGMYTDPQIHTLSGQDYGLGNMGKKGIDKWIAAHKCGPLCVAIDLTPLQAPPAKEPRVHAVNPVPRFNVQIDPRQQVAEMRQTFRRLQAGGTPPPQAMPGLRQGPPLGRHPAGPPMPVPPAPHYVLGKHPPAPGTLPPKTSDGPPGGARQGYGRGAPAGGGVGHDQRVYAESIAAEEQRLEQKKRREAEEERLLKQAMELSLRESSSTPPGAPPPPRHYL
eukprot:TRINITY_DN810_c1_g1_i1.p1 TRINITY_DN810_c1_g1~~TRINITY_DN810_c1_g1_i1.p1  ORF type:complete len:417 (+),score=139.49 TRINITY_DN810_c1_g1_i1:72-1322(+)